MKPGTLRKLLLPLIVAVAVVMLYWGGGSRSGTVENDTKPAEIQTRSTRPNRQQERSLRDETARRKLHSDWESLLAWLESDPGPAAQEVRGRLLATRTEWAEMDLQVLATGIEALLATGKDAKTGLGFQVGPHGLLKSWPTMRVFLLDLLATSDPEMAARIARVVLDQTSSADEFAVALRSLTREGLGRAPDAELLSRFNGMLQRENWHGAAGFAEACDLPRLLGSTEAARVLADWNGNPGLRNMALAELAADHPAAVLAALDDKTTLDGITKATLMARANPADASQLAAVDTYLRDSQRTSGEAIAFLKAYPLRSATTGFRLYGKPPAPYNYETIAAGDRAALELAGKWADDPALAAYREPLLSLKKRLEEWTAQTR
jgi:hypothetical protein